MSDISFGGSTFQGVDFSGRKLAGNINFGYERKYTTEKRIKLKKEAKGQIVYSDDPGSRGLPDWEYEVLERRPITTFSAPPVFHDCTIGQGFHIHEDIEFPRPSINRRNAADAYRTLKLAFSKLQAIREEQRFFKLEMEEETLRETGLKRQLFVAYKYFSDYGFSITRPFTLLIVFPALYVSLFNAFLIEYQIYQCYDFFNQAPISIFWNWLTWSFISIVAVPGVDLGKEIRPLLFGAGSFISFIALMIEIIQKALALAGFFLIGLALRNLFKLK